MQSPSNPEPGPPDGLEAARKRWAEEKQAGEWERAARRQEERHRAKAKPATATEQLPNEGGEA
jgi:hypothetical protein